MKARAVATSLAAAALAVLAGAACRSSKSSDAAPRASSSPVAVPGSAATVASNPTEAHFVGSAACSGCHKAEAAAYQASHHARALRLPDAKELTHRFEQAGHATKLGGPVTLSQQADALALSNQGRAYPVAYVAGVAPLDQYILDAGQGHLQALGLTYQTADDRGSPSGRRGWFHLYAARGLPPEDPRHFTKPAQNWNHVCADCHSTDVQRRYDAAKDRFETRWQELSVGCEACHGPGSAHVAAAAQGKPGGLTVTLLKSPPWLPAANGSPAAHARDDRQMETCAPCHSRRETLAEGHHAGSQFLDYFEPELLRPARYFADGQVDGEVYEWGSFQQSEMYRAGVRCSDCHDPHSGKLRAEGDALCTSCHSAQVFAGASHSHHQGDKAPGCADCHMPSRTFMEVDARRDHSLRIPRPDLTAKYGVPNACSACHADKGLTFSVAAQAKWFPTSLTRPHFVEALGAERLGQPGAAAALRALAADAAAPPIARATALELLAEHPGASTQAALQKQAFSEDALVALGAALGASRLPPPARYELLIPMLSHPRRAVRLVVGRALADAPLAELGPEARSALGRVWAEVESSFDLAAVLPATHVERAAFELRRGRPDAAKDALRAAFARDACSAEAWVNLAELARQSDDEAASEKALRRALECDRGSAEAHFALGLGRVRAGQQRQGLTELEHAVRLAPQNARFALGLAACHAALNQDAQARAVIERALDARQEDTELLGALAAYQKKLGDSLAAERALAERQRLLR